MSGNTFQQLGGFYEHREVISFCRSSYSSVGIRTGPAKEPALRNEFTLCHERLPIHFTSGSGQTFLKFCVTVNGNITQLQSPAGYEHIREGRYQEGYAICDFGTTSGVETKYFDYADGGDSGNWQAPVTTQP